MQEDLRLSAYRYHLPPELIAQHPTDRRDQSRLMVLDRGTGTLAHRTFSALPELVGAKDLLVLNDTRVFPARLYGRKESGGKVEVLLLDYPQAATPDTGTATATALIKASKQPKIGSRISFADLFQATVVSNLGDGKHALQLSYEARIGLARTLEGSGHIPLPPYISRKSGECHSDRGRYQTVYATQPGAVAAPTAGLHFTPELLTALTGQGTLLGRVTLHVGYGTFAPVREEEISRHQIHREFLTIPAETVALVAKTRARGGKIWAVGTTSVRALEFGAGSGTLQPFQGWCDLYIYPGYRFRVVDNLITNFHLPDSSLLFLVAALCGRETLLTSYDTAIREGYRFFSYGDAMAIITGQGDDNDR
jgi:S-adenosylmethionine:tRNA ribosyltransferase-isomerase